MLITLAGSFNRAVRFLYPCVAAESLFLRLCSSASGQGLIFFDLIEFQSVQPVRHIIDR